MVGVSLAQCLQRMVGVGGTRQGELEVAGSERGVGGYGKARHCQSLLLVEQGEVKLQGVLWAHHEPYFVHQALLADVGREGGVPEVDGVERTSEDADALHALVGKLKDER